MPSATSNEGDVLFRYLRGQRERIFEALEGLDVDGLRRQVLPSHWSCLGLVNHLSLDVERFWFQAVIAGEQAAVEDVLGSSDNALTSTPSVLAIVSRNRSARRRVSAL